jgi:hypothetical protein
LCLLPHPSGWKPDLERLLPLRVLSFAASCRQRFEAGSRAPLRDFGGVGSPPVRDRQPWGWLDFGDDRCADLPVHRFGAPQPLANAAGATCGLRG